MLVVAAVIERQGRVLVCQRPRHKHHGLLWEFPGGKVEPGESIEEALSRELREELGLEQARAGRELYRHEEPARGLTLVFIEAHAEGEPRCIEHEALTWVDPGQPHGLTLAPGDQAFWGQLAGSLGKG